jgi:hypothetical protein
LFDALMAIEDAVVVMMGAACAESGNLGAWV